MDTDQLLQTLSTAVTWLPLWAQHALALSGLFALVLALVVKPIALRFAPLPEHWPAWARAVLSALEVVALNSAPIWKLVQLGLTQSALKNATTPPPAPPVFNVDELGRQLSHPLESPARPWAESVPPPPEPPPLPPKDGAA